MDYKGNKERYEAQLLAAGEKVEQRESKKPAPAAAQSDEE